MKTNKFNKIISLFLFSSLSMTSWAMGTTENNLAPKESYEEVLTKGGFSICHSVQQLLSAPELSTILKRDTLASDFPYIYDIEIIYSNNCLSEETTKSLGFNSYILTQLSIISGAIANDGALTRTQRKLGMPIMLESDNLLQLLSHWNNI